jgi:hypothetical protein
MRQQSGKKDERDNSSEQYVLEGAPPRCLWYSDGVSKYPLLPGLRLWPTVGRSIQGPASGKGASPMKPWANDP